LNADDWIWCVLTIFLSEI